MVHGAQAALDPAEDRLQVALGVLRGAGLRCTPRRIAVLRALIEAGEHLSLAQITERLRLADGDADFSTTWRTVLTLEELGLVHALRSEATPIYGVADQPHSHALCRGCGKVAELPAGRLEMAIGQIEQVSGFSMDGGSLLATGTCPDCS